MALALNLVLKKLGTGRGGTGKYWRQKDSNKTSKFTKDDWESYAFDSADLMLGLYPQMVVEPTKPESYSQAKSRLLQGPKCPSISSLRRLILESSTEGFSSLSNLVKFRVGASEESASVGRPAIPLALEQDLRHTLWQQGNISSWGETRFAFASDPAFRDNFNKALNEELSVEPDGGLLSDKRAFWLGVDGLLESVDWSSFGSNASPEEMLEEILYAESSLLYCFVMAGLEGAGDHASDVGIYDRLTGAPRFAVAEAGNLAVLTPVIRNGSRFVTDARANPVSSDTWIRVGASASWCKESGGAGFVSQAEEVSGKHFEIHRKGNQWHLRDVGSDENGSTNATLVYARRDNKLVKIWLRGPSVYIAQEEGDTRNKWVRVTRTGRIKLGAGFLAEVPLASGDVICAAPLAKVNNIPTERAILARDVVYEANPNRSGVCFRFEIQTNCAV